MTDALFLARLPDDVGPGTDVKLDGDEGHHAVAVKRIALGERVIVADGAGRGAWGTVVTVGKGCLTMRVDEVRTAPRPRWSVVQALAKGERSELAVQLATEVGADRILAWEAARSIVRLRGDRADKLRRKWQATARESAKQSRRLWVPEIHLADTGAVERAIEEADVALILHEEAAEHIAQVSLQGQGSGLVIVGPEGGIAPDEVTRFQAAGARLVTISDGVLRTSTAAAVALGQVEVLGRREL